MTRRFAALATLSLLAAVLLLACANLPTAPPSSTSKELTFAEVAAKLGAIEAKAAQIYKTACKPGAPGAGGVVVTNFIDILSYGAAGYTSPGGTKIGNAIVIRNVTPLDTVRRFVGEEAWFALVDTMGKEYSDISALTGTASFDPVLDFAPAIIVLEASADPSGYPYLLVGGYDSASNGGKTRLLFHVSIKK